MYFEPFGRPRFRGWVVAAVTAAVAATVLAVVAAVAVAVVVTVVAAVAVAVVATVRRSSPLRSNSSRSNPYREIAPIQRFLYPTKTGPFVPGFLSCLQGKTLSKGVVLVYLGPPDPSRRCSDWGSQDDPLINLLWGYDFLRYSGPARNTSR